MGHWLISICLPSQIVRDLTVWISLYIYIYYIRACNDQTLIVACLRSRLDNRMFQLLKSIDFGTEISKNREEGEEKYRKRTESEIFYSRARSINRICIMVIGYNGVNWVAINALGHHFRLNLLPVLYIRNLKRRAEIGEAFVKRLSADVSTTTTTTFVEQLFDILGWWKRDAE